MADSLGVGLALLSAVILNCVVICYTSSFSLLRKGPGWMYRTNCNFAASSELDDPLEDALLVDNGSGCKVFIPPHAVFVVSVVAQYAATFCMIPLMVDAFGCRLGGKYHAGWWGAALSQCVLGIVSISVLQFVPKDKAEFNQAIPLNHALSVGWGYVYTLTSLIMSIIALSMAEWKQGQKKDTMLSKE